MQKLWIVSELMPPDETSTSYILGEIAKALASKYDVNVICGPEIYDKRKGISDTKLPDYIKINRVKGVNLDKNTLIGKLLSFFIITYRLNKKAKQLIKSEDKVLMVTNPAPLVVPMSHLKSRIGFSLSILVHDVFPENTKPAGLNIPSLIYDRIKRIFDKAYSKADRLIVIGRDMAEIVMVKTRHSSHIPAIDIIENWGDVEQITPLPFPKSDKIILQYAGNIGRAQGLENIIKELPEGIEFHIYGTGAMENSLKKLNHPNVYFHGAYKRTEQTEILGNCHISLVTLQEGMYGLGVPSKTYNIMASGRPVLFLGPEGSEIDLLIKEHRIGYCSWPESWNRSELVEMGNIAREIAVKHFSKGAILKKFTDII